MSPLAPHSWIDKLRTAKALYLVDRAGCIHTLTPEAYASLPLADLRGSSVFLTRREADRCAAKRRQQST